MDFTPSRGSPVVLLSGLTVYDYEPYTMQNVLQYEGKYYVCGTGRQALLKDKTVNDNYYGVYHGVREGYSGNYLPDGGGAWEAAISEGDIYSFLDLTLGTQEDGGRHVKYAGDGGEALEFAIDSLTVTVRNAPLAPSDPQNAARFEADAVIRLEVPVRFAGMLLPSMHITVKVQAGYIEVF